MQRAARVKTRKRPMKRNQRHKSANKQKRGARARGDVGREPVRVRVGGRCVAAVRRRGDDALDRRRKFRPRVARNRPESVQGSQSGRAVQSNPIQCRGGQHGKKAPCLFAFVVLFLKEKDTG